MKAAAILAAATLLTACASTTPTGTGNGAATAGASPAAQSGTVVLAPASGSLVSGRLDAMAMAGGVHFTGEIGGLTPNSQHGLHVHERGDCSAADASSAGGHFNPAGAPHGGPDAPARHAGDLGNVTADASGVAHVNVHAMGTSLGGGGSGDIAGRALVVHAQPDDYTSQPAGNSGARVACGVITVQR